VHDYVVFAHFLLTHLGLAPASDDKWRASVAKWNAASEKYGGLSLKKSEVFSDLRVLDLYDSVKKQLSERNRERGQISNESDDAPLFVVAQFLQYQDVVTFVEENFPNLKKETGSNNAPR
jgi:hypothetical protein